LVAGGDEPALEVTAPRGAVSVGERVPVRVAARGGDGWLWGELEVRAGELGPWEVVERPQPVSGTQPPEWQLVLAPMAVGDQPLPELAVTARPPDGAARTVTPVALPTVTVASVLPPDQEVAPAPLRDPVGAVGFPWEWVAPAALLLAPLAAVVAWWLRRRRAAAAADAAARVPPIIALEALLDELEARVGRAPAAGLCDQLALGLRGYLERRSGEPALEMTSFELRRMARRSRWPDLVQRSLHRTMGVADEVRFARRQVTDAALVEAISCARAAGRGLEQFLAEQEQPQEAAG
jgi:hypothetical protein